MHCRRFVEPALSRRDMLLRCANGFGALALAALLREPAFGAALGDARPDRSDAGPSPHEPAGAPAAALPGAGPRASSSCSWTAARRRSTRSTPSPGSTASTASRSRSRRSRRSSTTWATCSSCPWKFRQYGESGIPVSDLFPHVGRLRRRPGDHPLDGLELLRAHERQLLPAHRQRAAGPAEPGRLGDLRPGQRVPGPARLRRAQRRPDPAGRHRLLQQRLPAGGLPGLGLQARRRRRSPTSRRPSRRPSCQRRKLDLLRTLDQGVLGRMGHHDSLEAAIANYELAFRMQTAVPELMRPGRRVGGDAAALRPRRSLSADADLRPRVPDRPAAGRARRPVRRAALPERRRRPLGPARRPQERPREQRPRRRPADRRPAQGPQGPRPARLDAGRLGRRVRPHADGPGHRRPRPQPLRLHRSGWPAAASRAAPSTAPPTTTATMPSRTRSRSTTCTPRCSTSWAWTTSG